MRRDEADRWSLAQRRVQKRCWRHPRDRLEPRMRTRTSVVWGRKAILRDPIRWRACVHLLQTFFWKKTTRDRSSHQLKQARGTMSRRRMPPARYRRPHRSIVGISLEHQSSPLRSLVFWLRAIAHSWRCFCQINASNARRELMMTSRLHTRHLTIQPADGGPPDPIATGVAGRHSVELWVPRRHVA